MLLATAGRKSYLVLAMMSTEMLLIAPLHVAASEPCSRRTSSPIADVRLATGNTLTGVVYDRQGIGLAGIRVTARHLADGNVASGSTNADGIFNLRSMRPGVYSVSANGDQQIVGLWSHGTAPPNARPAVGFVVDSPLVRGQFGARHPSYPHPIDGYPAQDHPRLFGAGMAVLIGGIIAINTIDDDHRSGS